MLETLNIDSYVLSFLIFFPLLGIIPLLLIPSSQTRLLKIAALTLFLIEMLVSFHLPYHFTNTTSPHAFGVNHLWISHWKIYYFLGIDGVSLLLIVLTTVTMPLALLGTWNSVKENVKGYLIALLLLQTGIIGVFCALDLFLFYVFWEIMLIPMYFLIGLWGGANRIYATLKFFIYTMAGSVIMLVGILYMYHKSMAVPLDPPLGLFNLYSLNLSFSEQLALFMAFGLAFAIKIPLFPFHTWLPDAHVQAPTIGSVILAGVLLKLGSYGFYRFAIPLFPDAIVYLQDYLIGAALIGVVYGALVAMIQPDIKKLVAYSSVSHMGIVMLGLFSMNSTAITGGMYQMFNHAVSTGGLFLLIGMLYDRTHTRNIADYSGLAKLMPVFTVFFIIVTMSSIGVPLTNGFVGEFLTLLGTYQFDKFSAIVGATGIVLGAIYMLWMVERVFFGPVKKTEGANTDLNRREMSVMAVIAIFIFVMGIYPKPFLEKIESATAGLLDIHQAALVDTAAETPKLAQD